MLKNNKDYEYFIKKCTGLSNNNVHHFIKGKNNKQYCKYCGCPFFTNPLCSPIVQNKIFKKYLFIY
jgi:hypothetical protein